MCQKIGVSGKKVVVRQNLPSQSIPLQVEPAKSTLQVLVKMLAELNTKFTSGVATKCDKVIVISTLRLLTVNLHQLRQGRSDSEALASFREEDRGLLRAVLESIIDNEPTDLFSETLCACASSVFISGLNLLYPTANDRQTLLQNYLKQYTEGNLSKNEKGILELILKQASGIGSLSSIVDVGDAAGVSSLLTTLMNLLRNEVFASLKLLSGAELSTASDSRAAADALATASVQLITSLSKVQLSKASQSIVVAMEANGENERQAHGQLGSTSALSILASMTKACSEVLASSVAVNSALGNSLDLDVDGLLKGSLVGALLPTTLATSSILLSSYGANMIEWSDEGLLKEVYFGLHECSQALQPLLTLLPKDLIFSVKESSSVKSTSTVYESSHPYPDGQDTRTEISFPGATKIVISFDPASRTEGGCDYVTFRKENGESLHPQIEKFTGRDGAQVRIRDCHHFHLIILAEICAGAELARM